MKKIYLFCSAGLSTSMLAANMQKVAESHNLPITVKAFPHSSLTDIMATDRPDAVLLGPQVKYMLKETEDKFGSTGVPIFVIDSGDYGAMNGEKVLKTAIAAMKKAAKK